MQLQQNVQIAKSMARAREREVRFGHVMRSWTAAYIIRGVALAFAWRATFEAPDALSVETYPRAFAPSG